jgi:hypothetical protein
MSKRERRVPRIIWLITPTITVLFVLFIIYISKLPVDTKIDTVKSDAQTILNGGIDSAKKTIIKKMDKPNYTFYKLLEEQDVEINERKAYRSTPKGEQTNFQSVLQVASFRSKEDADELRADLILSTLHSYVKVSSLNNNTWYRVYVGPFTNRSKLNKAQDILASRNLDSIVIKQRVKK